MNTRIFACNFLYDFFFTTTPGRHIHLDPPPPLPLVPAVARLQKKTLSYFEEHCKSDKTALATILLSGVAAFATAMHIS